MGKRRIKHRRVVIYLDTPGGRKCGESSATSLAEAERNLKIAEEELKQAERAQRFGLNKDGFGSTRPLDIAVSQLADSAHDYRIVAALAVYGEKEVDVRDAIREYILWDGREPSEWRYTEAYLQVQAARAVWELFTNGYTDIRRTYPDAFIQ